MDMDVQAVQAAIMTAYQNPDPATQKAESQRLIEFMEEPQSWRVFQTLLESPLPAVKFFAAQAFVQKIRLYWDQLATDEMKSAVRLFVFNLCRQYARDRNYSMRSRACIALAALAVRSGLTTWPNFMEDLIEVFRVQEYTVEEKTAIMESLSYLPEELDTTTLPMAQVYASPTDSPSETATLTRCWSAICPTTVRSELAGKLVAHVPTLFSVFKVIVDAYIYSIRQQPPGPNASQLEKLTVTTFRTLAQWAQLRIPSTGHAALTVRVLFELQMFDPIFDAIPQSPAMFVAGVDFLLEVFGPPAGASSTSFSSAIIPLSGALSPNKANGGSLFSTGSALAASTLHLSLPPELVGHVLTRVVSLRHIYQTSVTKTSAAGEHLNVCRAAAQLVVGVGELNATLLAADGLSHNQLVTSYLQFALECTANRSKEVSELCFGFWSVLANFVNSFNEFGPIYQQVLRLAVANSFHRHEEQASEADYYRQLSHGATKQHFRQGDVGLSSSFGAADADDFNEFSTFGFFLSKAIRASFIVLGPDPGLKFLQELIPVHIPPILADGNDWQTYEGVYFALKEVVSFVNSTLGPEGALQRWRGFWFLSLATVQSRAKDLPPVVFESILSFWSTCAKGIVEDYVTSRSTAQTAPTAFEAILALALASLDSSVGSVGICAANVIGAFCSFSNLPPIFEMVPAIVARYSECYQRQKLEDRHVLVSALVSLIYSSGQPTQMAPGLEAILRPTLAALGQLSSQPVAAGIADQIIMELKTLQCAFEIHPPSEVIAAVNSNHPMLSALATLQFWQLIEFAHQTWLPFGPFARVLASLYSDVIKELIGHLGESFSILAQPALTQAVLAFQTKPLPVILECIELLIDLFGAQPGAKDFLSQALQQVASSASLHLQTPQGPNSPQKQSLELIGAFLSLNATTLRTNPVLLLITANASASTQLLDGLFQLASNALFSQDVETVAQVLNFIDSFLFGPHVTSDANWKQYADHAVQYSSIQLVKGLLTALANLGSHFKISSLAKLFFQLVSQYRPIVEPALAQALAAPELWPMQAQLGAQQPALLLQQRDYFARSILSLPTLRRFKALLLDYADFRNGKMTSDFVVAYQM